MLRVTQRFEISLRKKRSPLTLDGAKALTLALLFHLILWMTFKIVTPPYLEQSRPLPPSTVEIDLSINEAPTQPLVEILLSPLSTVDRNDCFDNYLEGSTRNSPPSSFSLKKMNVLEPNFEVFEHIRYVPALLEEEIDDDQR